MGLRSWIKKHTGHGGARGTRDATETRSAAAVAPMPAGTPAANPEQDMWEPLPAFLPVDPRGHEHVCVIASAIAAGDHPTSEFRVKRVLVANPEYRTVSVIATALAAGALEKSSFTVKNIYKMKEEGSHAA